MAPELRSLLDDVVEHPPTEPHPVEQVVRRARRSRRRHQVVAIGGGTLAVALVIGVAVVVHPGRGTDAPVVDNSVHGPVVHPADAVAGVEGRDYDVFATYDDPNLEQANGRLFPEVTTNGEVLVSDSVRTAADDQGSADTRYGLLSPTSGQITWLPAPPGAPTGAQPTVVTTSEDTVVWLDDVGIDQPTWRVSLYDRSKGTWTELTIPIGTLPHESFGSVPDRIRLADGRLWFTLDPAVKVRRLWSVPVDGSAAPRLERRVGSWDLDGDTLAFTDVTNAPASRVTVVDLASGSSTTFDPMSGDRCNQLGLLLSGQRIALDQYCGTRKHVRDDRVQVLGTDGDPVVTVQGQGVGTTGLSGKLLSVQSALGEPSDGTYAYDFDEKRLVQLGTGSSMYAGAGGAGGSTITWGTPLGGRDGLKLWAATWR